MFITGASSGVGEALAIEYAKRYAGQQTVIGLVARRGELLQKCQANLQKNFQTQVAIYALDVRDANALNDAAQQFMHDYGTPNIVIACAGVSRGTLTEYAEDNAAFQAMMDINVMGVVYTFQPFIDAMRKNAALSHQAQLVGIASVAGIRGLPGAGAYSASKAAVINYLESLRIEMAAHHIDVTTIAPGYIRTPMTDVNQYTMPFLMDVDVAAHQFVNVIESKRRFVIVPWQMAWVARCLRLIPPVAWDWIMKKAPHKTRDTNNWS